MKRILAIITFAAIACTFANARHTDEWKEKMRSEKIAFLTMEMNITPEEAQVFWPVYNQVEQQKDAALGEVIQAYKALNAAVESNENVEKCLNAYLQAQINFFCFIKVSPEIPTSFIENILNLLFDL